MTTQLERIRNELKIAGYDLIPIPDNKVWDADDYVQNIGNCAYEICKIFCDQDHSGMSARYTLQLIEKLLDGDTLTPLTNNPNEWIHHDFEPEGYYQSIRDFSCFSDDNLKTYYDIDEEANQEYELDKDGNETEWYSLKPKEQLVKHILKSKEELQAERK